jgi:hypothetical protein
MNRTSTYIYIVIYIYTYKYMNIVGCNVTNEYVLGVCLKIGDVPAIYRRFNKETSD